MSPSPNLGVVHNGGNNINNLSLSPNCNIQNSSPGVNQCHESYPNMMLSPNTGDHNTHVQICHGGSGGPGGHNNTNNHARSSPGLRNSIHRPPKDNLTDFPPLSVNPPSYADNFPPLGPPQTRISVTNSSSGASGKTRVGPQVQLHVNPGTSGPGPAAHQREVQIHQSQNQNQTVVGSQVQQQVQIQPALPPVPVPVPPPIPNMSEFPPLTLSTHPTSGKGPGSNMTMPKRTSFQ